MNYRNRNRMENIVIVLLVTMLVFLGVGIGLAIASPPAEAEDGSRVLPTETFLGEDRTGHVVPCQYYSGYKRAGLSCDFSALRDATPEDETVELERVHVREDDGTLRPCLYRSGYKRAGLACDYHTAG